MPTDRITYQDSGYFSPLITDYLNQDPTLAEFYNRYPEVQNFKAQADEKQATYDHSFRHLLVDVLRRQYNALETSDKTKTNIDSLLNDNTFTVTTGHQLNIFTGPLYFLYKIISTLNLASDLNAHYPDRKFVPVFWMATEDHDFDEINHFHFKQTKYSWNREKAGPAGRLPTDGLEMVFSQFGDQLGISYNADYLRKLFSDGYLNHRNLTDATRYIANKLFGKYGLIILDADDAKLKKVFIPHMESDLFRNTAFNSVSKTIEKMPTVQVNPREINLFYMEDSFRERIIFEDDTFYVNNTDIKFTANEIRDELQENPQKFSPNVIMRPLYQEVLLPNLCYIGGGAEVAYWFELRSYFEAESVTFPIVMLRNSVMLATQKQAAKLDRLNVEWKDVFLSKSDVESRFVRKISEFPIDLSEQRAALELQFDQLEKIAAATDKSFTGAVLAQRKKQISGLNNLEKRLLKAQKKKHADELQRLTDLQNELFPNGTLQERRANFSEFYLEYGEVVVEELIKKLDPFSNEFSILVL
ncbi:MAG: bacillithiol biosynthesis cysteine-adding enzyme BshC [Flavobacterium sp.]|nr:bacillithiol biosynthesis cysteine-adding enzyme BshC [Flavobacterium sp.]